MVQILHKLRIKVLFFYFFYRVYYGFSLHINTITYNIILIIATFRSHSGHHQAKINLSDSSMFGDLSDFGALSDLRALSNLIDLSELRDLRNLSDWSDLRDLSDSNGSSDLRDFYKLPDVSDLSDLANLQTCKILTGKLANLHTSKFRNFQICKLAKVFNLLNC
jgi:hypothetical protein